MDTVPPPDAVPRVPIDPLAALAVPGEPAPPLKPPLAGALLMAVFGYPAGSVIGLVFWVVAVGFVRTLAPAWIPGHGARSAFTSATGILLLLAGAGVGSIAVTLLATLASPRPRAEQLGWLRPALDGWQWLLAFVVAAGASAFGASASALLQHLHVLPEIPPSSIVARLDAALRSAPLALGITLALASGIFPGVSEELLFRGYVLRRLARRLPPALAIGIAACAFSVWHWEPARVLATLPFALWIGYLAWRSNSVLPGIAIHVWTNAVLGLIELSVRHSSAATMHATNTQLVTALGIGFACGLLGLAGFEARRRARAAEMREPGEVSPPGPVT